MGNTIFGNGQKKHALIYINNNIVGQVIYYYWSESNILIRLHDNTKHITAQFYKKDVIVALEEEEYEPYIDEDGE